MGLREWLRPRYDGTLAAIAGGIADRVRDRTAAPLALDDRDRLEGRACLVTGANRGLGLAIAIALARRGGHVILACRSGIPEAMDEVRRAAASGKESTPGTVEGIHLDLGDLDRIERFVDELAEDGTALDVTVLNAGVVPREARRTKHGLDEQFQVNFLANVLLVRRLLERGVIGSRSSDPDDDDRSGGKPRIVLVSSEAHRSAAPIEWHALGAFRSWGMREAVKEYGRSKLLLETWAAELARRTPQASVHTVCPGAVATGIGREAPEWARPALEVTMKAFFKRPEVGAEPVVYLCASRAIEGETGIYLHANRRKDRSDDARSPDNGRRLWHETERILASAGYTLERT